MQEMPQNLFAKYGEKGFCGKFEGSGGRWRLNEADGEVSLVLDLRGFRKVMRPCGGMR